MLDYSGMKKDLHPQFNTKAKVVCACGNNFEVGSTVDEIHVEICSMCHPFYTGKQKLVDTARRVEKFQEKLAKRETVAAGKTGKKAKRERAAKKKETAKNEK